MTGVLAYISSPGRTEQGQGTTQGARALPGVTKGQERMEWWSRTRQTDVPQVAQVHKCEINMTRRQMTLSASGKQEKGESKHRLILREDRKSIE